MADATTSAGRAPRGETIEERIDRTRSQHTCIQRFDHFMYCFTPVNQLRRYYHDATTTTARRCWRSGATARAVKLEQLGGGGRRDPRARVAASVRGEHVWSDLPEYNDAAALRRALLASGTLAWSCRPGAGGSVT